MNKLLEKRHRRKKTKIITTYTTGDPVLNIKHFNHRMGTDFTNPSTEEAKKAAEAANKNIGLNTSKADPGEILDNLNDAGTDFDTSSTASAAEGKADAVIGEQLIAEAKREVRRYYIRPQHLFCANKDEIIKALIDIGNNNCSVYTLKNLGDEKDITKLTVKDIIYYYDNGILYDKNHVKVMDYNLYIKHEEERKKFSIETEKVPDTDFKKEYEDRLTTKTEFTEAKRTRKKYAPNNPFELDFPNINVFGEDLDHKQLTCCICGEPIEGYGNNPAPVKTKGRCCDACNLKFVIPARIEIYNKNHAQG